MVHQIGKGLPRRDVGLDIVGGTFDARRLRVWRATGAIVIAVMYAGGHILSGDGRVVFLPSSDNAAAKQPGRISLRLEGSAA